MKLRYTLILVLLCLFMAGCGKYKQLEEYRNHMAAFTSGVSDISAKMEQIDTTSDTAVNEVLACLDEMEAQFLILADIEVPKEFASVESLADEASEYMSEAVSLYHEIFSAQTISEDDGFLAAAQENYDRAMKRISYISTLLQGELPQGDDVFVTEEEVLDFTPVTEESDF